MRCHLQTQLSSGLITAIKPSKLLLVQSYTLSLLFFIRRNSSQLSQPSTSNWSNDWKENENKLKVSIDWRIIMTSQCGSNKITLTNEHTKQARSPRKSFGIESKDISMQLLKSFSFFWIEKKKKTNRCWIGSKWIHKWTGISIKMKINTKLSIVFMVLY